MRKDCVCRGRNKNCIFCSGSGYIEGKIEMPPVATPFKIKRVTEKNLKMVVCEHCKQPVFETRFKRHLRRVHGINT